MEGDRIRSTQPSRKEGKTHMQVMAMVRQRDLIDHIAAVDQLGTGEIEALKRLALQLQPSRILPVVGAGASFDCGMRVAREIAEDLYEIYRTNPEWELDESVRSDDLASIAEAIFAECKDQTRVVEALGLPDAALWRPAPEMGAHFCGYCVLARMVKERLLGEAFSFNYDCGAEAALIAEGFVSGEISAGRHWRDRARIIADAKTHLSTAKDPAAFTLFKANGCAERYREMAIDDEEKAAREIIVRTEQINTWKEAAWSRNTFRSLVEGHVLLLIGFSGQDPKFSVELREVLDQIFREGGTQGSPRVVVIDRASNPSILKQLIDAGLNGEEPAEGVVTRISTGQSTATAALLVLLVELLAIELSDALESAGLQMPTELDARISTLAISAPTMRRWAYLVGVPGEGDLIQRANQLADGGYVPLTHAPDLTASLIGARATLRGLLGLVAEESPTEALDCHGFLVDPAGGLAYIPVGIGHEELMTCCRPGPELDKVRAVMAAHYPSHLDCVLVGGDGSARRGVSLETGKTVEL